MDTSRHAHLRWRYVGLVAVGGSVGTASRYLITEAVGSWQHVPIATLGINVLGAFGLGALVEMLLRHGRDEGGGHNMRLLVGTGFFGGFTTYSALAVETVALGRDGLPWLAVGYALVTLLAGALATACGIALSSSRHRRRHPGFGETRPGRIS